MTAKEYLQQAFRIDQRINGKMELAARLRESATKVTTHLSDMPRASSPNLQTMEDTVAKIVDLEADINRDVDALVDLKREIVKTIDSLEKPEHQMILESRYLCYKSWEQIALEISDYTALCVGDSRMKQTGKHPRKYIVRRLLPIECCRLQGYPDGWTENLGTETPTEEEIAFWTDVFLTWQKAQGKPPKPRSRTTIIRWLNNPRTDAAEYKAYGNSVAAPCVHFVLAGIVWASGKETKP